MYKYLFFLVIFLIPFSSAYAITYSSTNPTIDGYVRDSDNDNNCEAVPASASKFASSQILAIGRITTAAAEDCSAAYYQYDLSSIPNTAVIADVDFLYEVEVLDTAGNPAGCDFVQLAVDTTTATNLQIWTGIQSSGTVYVSNDAGCSAAGNNKSVDLGTSAENDIQSALTGTDRFALGIRGTGGLGATDATNRQSYFAGENDNDPAPLPTLRIVYQGTAGVTDLIATDIRPTSVDLSWSQPTIYFGSLYGYQVNKTTPWNSNVATIYINNTNTTSYTVNGLSGSTQYSFRIGPWDSLGGNNVTGNVLNITTDVDPTAQFTPGTFSTNFTGTDVRQIFYTRTDLNSTYTRLNVTATNTIELNCNFYYEYAMTNKTFTNIANTSISSTRDMSSFVFRDVDQEVIHVLCWDQYDNTTNSKYVITQTHFPFLEQIENFRNGTFGTHGQFGAIDFISMIAIICSMIGFNRVNETVGIVFGLFMVGALAVLSNGSIISWDSTFTVGFAVLMMWAIGMVRKD